jgi:hypothetical protein
MQQSGRGFATVTLPTSLVRNEDCVAAADVYMWFVCKTQCACRYDTVACRSSVPSFGQRMIVHAAAFQCVTISESDCNAMHAPLDRVLNTQGGGLTMHKHS